MPELPDLVHVEDLLREALAGKTISSARTGDPTVLRYLVREPFPALLAGRRLGDDRAARALHALRPRGGPLHRGERDAGRAVQACIPAGPAAAKKKIRCRSGWR